MSVLLCSCSPKYNVINNNEDVKSVVLSKGASAYISIPEDSTSNGHLYVGSGKEVSTELEFLFSKHFNNVVTGDSVETCKQGLLSAKAKEYDYQICPQLLQWEDYATEWSGIPDKLKLKVSITNTKSGEIIDTFLLEGNGKVMSWGGDHPLDISKEPMTQWVDSLF